MAKVTGIGGVFFKSRKNQSALIAWYKKNLGMHIEDWGGAILRWPDDKAEDRGLTVWSVAQRDTEWFLPSTSSFMINYRVQDLNGMISKMRRSGVKVLKGPESHENGQFAWVMDPDGNKVELWEPLIWDEKNKRPTEGVKASRKKKAAKRSKKASRRKAAKNA
jgi:predicted enzyme related to lactoylglutathione lyase